MKTRIWKYSAALAAIMAANLVAGSAAADSNVESEIAAIQERYQQEFGALQREGERLSEDAPTPTKVEAGVGIDFDVEWEITSIKFDIPEVFMKTREFKMHLPQFRMKRTSIKWDNPETYWAVTKVGEYPCFKGWKWYSCDIKTKVPQIRMVRREAKFDVPEVFWDITSFKMDIPEFYSKRVEIKLHLPQFYAKDVDVQVEAHKAKAEEISLKAEILAGQQKAEINEVVAIDLREKREDAVAQFDGAIASLEQSIEKIRAAGANPEAIASETGTENLVAKLKELRMKRNETVALFDQKIGEFASTGA